ncbi:CPBP family intramembrane metalloprotease [Streptococcus gallolyticus]|nr:CPBP family intramembrane metalloprotease [Streptococcus gallolyticus]MBY5041137.1 CPBP family intramembrane metalloprotease [Streptococcus gallolyticus]
MKKKMLAAPTALYDRLPSWLFVILACLMVEVFFMAGNMVGGILIGILSVVLVTAEIVNGLDLMGILSSPHVQLILFAFVAAGLMLWVKFVEGRPLSSLGFFKMKRGLLKEIRMGWLVGTGLFSAAMLLSFAFGGLTFTGVDVSAASLGFVLSLVPLWFIQGGTEELLTRGWLLPLIYRRTNLAVAIGVSSSVFGFMHLGNSHVTLLSLVGLILSGIMMALYMLKTDNIWGVAALHAAWNFTQGNLYGIAVSGGETGKSILHFAVNTSSPEWISGGGFGTEGSLFSCLVELLAILYLWWALKKEKSSL